MFTGRFDDHFWNEYDWEAHLDEIEKKSEQLRKFIAPDPTGNIPRWVTLLQENPDEFEAVDAFIEEELQIEEAYFPDEDDEWEDDELDDDFDDFFYDEDFEDELFLDEDEDEFEEGEEWKELSDDFAMSDYGSIDMLGIYNDARELAAHVLQWAERIHPKTQGKKHNDFVSSVLKIGAKVAAGYSFGFEQGLIGGNIAYTKKALYHANDALAILQSNLRKSSHFSKGEYGEMHAQLFELRNSIGIYIQELRERFNLGLE